MHTTLRLALLPLLTLGLGCPAQEEPPPNVLLISVDTLRADHLQAYGYDRVTAPNVERLAAEGVLFEQMIAETSWTLPSHLTILTGLPSRVHQVILDDRRLHEDRRTLAEYLREAGYRTEAFVSAPYLNPLFGFDQGFERYVVLGEEDVESPKIADVVGRTPGWRKDMHQVHFASHRTRTSVDLADLVVEAVDRLADVPFFLFVHMFDPHFDYQPPEAYWRRFNPDYAGDLDAGNYARNPAIRSDMPDADLEQLLALYDGEILYTDEQIGRMLDALEGAGLTDRTLVALIADHGEEFFEHGGKGHRRTLFDEQLLVPFVLRLPGLLPPGRRVAMQVRMTDVLPTILEIAGVRAPPEWTGLSLLPFVLGDTPERDLPAISFLRLGNGSTLTSLRRGDRKLLVRRDPKGGTSRALFDLAADPGETRPQESGPAIEGTWRELAQIQRQEEALRARLGPAVYIGVLPDEMRAALEALGYVDAEPEEAP